MSASSLAMRKPRPDTLISLLPTYISNYFPCRPFALLDEGPDRCRDTLITYVFFPDRINLHQVQKLPNVIAQFDDEFHESSLPRKQRQRQAKNICWHRDDRLENAYTCAGRLLCAIHTMQKRLPHDVSTAPACGRNDLKDRSLGGPDEFASFFQLAAEKILILSGSEFWPEGQGIAGNQPPPEQRVSGARFVPVNAHSCGIDSAVINATLLKPLRGNLFEMSLDRP